MHLTLEDMLAALFRRVNDVERRLDNSARHGVVSDVDAAKHLVRLKIGGTDDDPQKSPWIPYGQIAGAMKVHSVPSVGQNMTAFSPTGDHRQAIALPFTWNNDNPSPSQNADEHVITFGNLKIVAKADSLSIAVGSSEIAFDESSINVIAGTIITVGKTYLGQENKGETKGPLVETVGGPAKITFAKV